MTVFFLLLSMLFSILATISYSYWLTLVLLGMSFMSFAIAVGFLISTLMDRDTVTPKCPEVKIPLRDSKGRYVKGHAPTHLKK